MCSWCSGSSLPLWMAGSENGSYSNIFILTSSDLPPPWIKLLLACFYPHPSEKASGLLLLSYSICSWHFIRFAFFRVKSTSWRGFVSWYSLPPLNPVRRPSPKLNSSQVLIINLDEGKFVRKDFDDAETIGWNLLWNFKLALKSVFGKHCNNSFQQWFAGMFDPAFHPILPNSGSDDNQ